MEQKQFLFIKYKKARLGSAITQTKITGQLEGMIKKQKDIDQESAALLALVHACQMHKVLAKDKQERKKIRKEMKKLVAENAIASNVDKVIKEIQVAVMAAVSASVGASSSTSSS